MAGAAETARLIAELSMDGRKFTAGVKKAIGDTGKLDSSLGKIGQSAKRGVKVAGAALAGLGAAAAVGIGAGIKSGIESLTELESAVTSTDGAIQQAGLTGKVTGAQIAEMANEIEAATQAAFDDKEITAGAGALIRYGKVTQTNLRPALEVMTDLAAKTGSVDSAATLLAKALADPAKAAGKLARQGVVLTKAEQDQIKAFMKAGKLGDAQAVVLASLERTTKGAAAAMNGPMKDAQQTLADVGEDSTRLLAKGFLPVLLRVADGLKKALGNKATMDAIESFGQGLAGAFDSLVDFAEGIDWGKIGSGLKTAADWGGKLIGAISKMPPEALAAIVALGGLNKLSGGAVSSIVGELGKGLIHGVLGLTAGVVNLKAASVVGGGGLPAGGGGAAPGGATSKLGKVASAATKVFLVGAAVGVAAELWGVKEQQTAANKEDIKRVGAQASGFASTATVAELQRSLNGIHEQQRKLATELTPEAIAYQLNIDGVKDAVNDVEGKLNAQLTALYDTRSEAIGQRRAIEGLKSTIGSQKPPTVTVSTNVKVNVTTNSITKSATIQKRVGGGTGSRDANFKGGWQPA